MRLDELVGYKSTPEHSQFKGILSGMTANQMLGYKRQAFNNWLSTNGFVSLGVGAYAMVFTHPGIDYCIKVFRNDDAYARFVNFCFTYKDDCVPRFRGKIIKIDERTSAIRMEKLEPLTWKNKHELWAIPLFSTYSFLPVMTPEERVEMLKSVGYGEQADYVLAHHNIFDMIDALKNIRTTDTFDLHRNNFMMRGNTLVITDPWQ